jgi:hypothetical protein
MNERIKELMIEAGIYECDDFEPHPTFKKFAELIVWECASKAWWAEQYDMGDGKPISKQITEHFGVEE